MAAYAEGLGVLQAANIGKQNRRDRRRDHTAARSRTLSVRLQPARRRRGMATRQRDRFMATGPDRVCVDRRSRLANSAGRVSDSGEGRWTVKASIDEGVPTPVLTTALYERFSSRGQADYCGQTSVRDALRVRRTPREVSPGASEGLKENDWNAD